MSSYYPVTFPSCNAGRAASFTVSKWKRKTATALWPQGSWQRSEQSHSVISCLTLSLMQLSLHPPSPPFILIVPFSLLFSLFLSHGPTGFMMFFHTGLTAKIRSFLFGPLRLRLSCTVKTDLSAFIHQFLSGTSRLRRPDPFLQKSRYSEISTQSQLEACCTILVVKGDLSLWILSSLPRLSHHCIRVLWNRAYLRPMLCLWSVWEEWDGWKGPETQRRAVLRLDGLICQEGKSRGRERRKRGKEESRQTNEVWLERGDTGHEAQPPSRNKEALCGDTLFMPHSLISSKFLSLFLHPQITNCVFLNELFNLLGFVLPPRRFGFVSVCLFVCLFVCRIPQKLLNGYAMSQRRTYKNVMWIKEFSLTFFNIAW